MIPSYQDSRGWAKECWLCGSPYHYTEDCLETLSEEEVLKKLDTAKADRERINQMMKGEKK